MKKLKRFLCGAGACLCGAGAYLRPMIVHVLIHLAISLLSDYAIKPALWAVIVWLIRWLN